MRAKGRSGHAATGHAVNAIDKGILVKNAIDDFGRSYAAQHPTCLTNVGLFKSGSHPATVPNEAEFAGQQCPYSVEDAERSMAQFGAWDGAAFPHAPLRTPWTRGWRNGRRVVRQGNPFQVSWIKDLYPFFCDPAHPAIQAALAASSEIEGRAVEARPISAWFRYDATLRGAWGIPAFGMGSSTAGAGAHGGANTSSSKTCSFGRQVAGARLLPTAGGRKLASLTCSISATRDTGESPL